MCVPIYDPLGLAIPIRTATGLLWWGISIRAPMCAPTDRAVLNLPEHAVGNGGFVEGCVVLLHHPRIAVERHGRVIVADAGKPGLGHGRPWKLWSLKWGALVASKYALAAS